MQSVSFGSHFEIEELSKKAFAHKAGKKNSASVVAVLKNTATCMAGTFDKFVLSSVEQNPKGQMFPAVLKFIPSSDTKGIQEASKVIEGKEYWGSEITSFMRNIDKEWLKFNVKKP